MTASVDPQVVTPERIHAAALSIASAIPVTECRHSVKLSKLTGAKIYVKYENHLPTGAFKERGALNKLLHLTEAEKAKGVIAASAGNHAQGLAYHAGRLKIPTVIVMSEDTPVNKVEQTKNLGAEVILTGNNFDDAYESMLKIRDERDLTLVHPFNDPDVISGQGTIGIEIFNAVQDLDAVVIPIGGGGMIAGISVALKALNPKIKIYGTQTVRYPYFYNQKFGHKSVDSGGSSIAEGIAVKRPGDLSFAIAAPLIHDIILVEEDQIEQAITILLHDEKTVAEGAGAAGLAAILAAPQEFRGKNVAFVLCGGNIDIRLLSSVLTRTLFRQERLFTVKTSINDRPGFLAEIADIIGREGGNIIEVNHNRYDLGMPAKDTGLSVTIEARDSHHARKIRAALTAQGCNLKA